MTVRRPKNIQKLIDLGDAELIERCKQNPRSMYDCLALNSLRSRVSKIAVKEGETPLVDEFYDPTDGALDLIMQAIVNNDSETLAVLLKKAILAPSEKKQLLLEAVTSPNIDILKLLVKAGAKPTKQTVLAAVRAANSAAVKYLSALVKFNPSELLDSAIETRRKGIVTTLLDIGAIPTDDQIAKAIGDSQWQFVKPLLKKMNIQTLSESLLQKINDKFGSIERLESFDAALKQHASMPQDPFAPEKELTDEFKERVEIAKKDLETYPDHQIKILARYLKIKDCENKSKDPLCKEIAFKLMYAHANQLPEDAKKCARYTRKISPEELAKIRAKVYKDWRRFKDSVTEMSSDELHEFFNMYDNLCFDGDIQKFIAEAKFSLQFKTAGESTFTTSGICMPQGSGGEQICDYTITIPTEFFKNAKKPTNVAGHLCKDQLECLQRVIEHEMVHLVIFMFCTDRFITDQHGPLFLNMVKDLFGHTDYRHYLF